MIPNCVRDFGVAKPLGLQLFDSCIEVVAHEVQDCTEQIMACVTLREIGATAMSGNLRGRQREGQSLVSRRDRNRCEHIVQRRLVRYGIVTVRSK